MAPRACARFLAPLLVCGLSFAQDFQVTQGQDATAFQELFDGETLDGWRVLPRKNPTGEWVVEDGALKPEGKPGALVSSRAFSDFELVVEWKVAAQGNSGIFYRLSPAAQNTSGNAIEYQIADNAREASQQNPDRRNGAAYGLYAPAEDASKPVGEWNQSRILAKGKHVEHWLNGVKVVEFETGSDGWKQRVAASKFDSPAFGTSMMGRIGLQDHGQAVWFRSVRIRLLGQKKVVIPVWERKQ